MSRSEHTSPEAIRAVARVRAPYARHGAGDQSSRQTNARLLKECGFVFGPYEPRTARDVPVLLPRIRVHRPHAGLVQPLAKRDVEAALQFFGPRCWYGIRSIELVQNVRQGGRAGCLFASYVTPGQILLYHQPPPPWILNGEVPPVVCQKLLGAGAVVNIDRTAGQTVIDWPGETFHLFILFDGLMHEVGHHILQQYTGKRRARIARTRDHEAFAERFAAHCRASFLLEKKGRE